MLSRMAPSSPPDMRTLHLLRTPDILCANDNRPLGSYLPVTLPFSIAAGRYLVTSSLRLQWLGCSSPSTGAARSWPPALGRLSRPLDGHRLGLAPWHAPDRQWCALKAVHVPALQQPQGCR